MAVVPHVSGLSVVRARLTFSSFPRASEGTAVLFRMCSGNPLLDVRVLLEGAYGCPTRSGHSGMTGRENRVGLALRKFDRWLIKPTRFC